MELIEFSKIVIPSGWLVTCETNSGEGIKLRSASQLRTSSSEGVKKLTYGKGAKLFSQLPDTV